MCYLAMPPRPVAGARVGIVLFRFWDETDDEDEDDWANTMREANTAPARISMVTAIVIYAFIIICTPFPFSTTCNRFVYRVILLDGLLFGVT